MLYKIEKNNKQNIILSMVARWYRWYEVLSSVFIFFYVPLAINLERALSASKIFYFIICTGDISSQNLIFSTSLPPSCNGKIRIQGPFSNQLFEHRKESQFS